MTDDLSRTPCLARLSERDNNTFPSRSERVRKLDSVPNRKEDSIPMIQSIASRATSRRGILLGGLALAVAPILAACAAATPTARYGHRPRG